MKPRTFGDMVHFARRSKRLTLDDLARAAGLSPNTIGLIERNATPTPGLEAVRRLCAALGLKLGCLDELPPVDIKREKANAPA